MHESDRNASICPGCHFRCELAEYQCARGAKLFGMLQNGEEIPEHRKPRPPKEGEKTAGGPPEHFKNIPVEKRLVMALSLFNRIMSDRQQETAMQRVAECISRHDGFAANGIIAERTRFTDEQIQKQVELLQAQGFATLRTESDGRHFHELTDLGKEQVKNWSEECKIADAELFAALSSDEKEQLVELLFKAIKPFMHHGPKNAK